MKLCHEDENVPENVQASVDNDDDLCAMLDEGDESEGGAGDDSVAHGTPAEELEGPVHARHHPTNGNPPKRKKSLLESLASSKAKSDATIAAILEEANAMARGEGFGGNATTGDGVDASNGAHREETVREAMLRRRGKDKSSLEGRHAKRARLESGTFVVDGRKPTASRTSTFDFEDKLFSKMDLRDVPFSSVVYNSKFEGSTIVDISELPDDPLGARAGHLGDFWVFGCLVRKVRKTLAKDGRKYAVWTLSNMQTGTASDAEVHGSRPSQRQRKIRFTNVNCLLFDDAFDSCHMRVEGAVFAFHKPSILPPRESRKCVDANDTNLEDWSGLCLRVKKKEDLLYVGICKSYALCGKHVRDRGECGIWYNKRMSSVCQRHTKERLRKMQSSSRMDIGNQERPGLARENTLGTVEPHNVTKCAAFEDFSSSRNEQQGVTPVSASAEERKRTANLKSELGLVKGGKGQKVPLKDPKTVLNFRSREGKKTAPLRGNQVTPFASHRRGITSTTGPQPFLSRQGTKQAGNQKLTKSQRACKDAIEVLQRNGFFPDTSGALIPPPAFSFARLGIKWREELKPALVLDEVRRCDGDAHAVEKQRESEGLIGMGKESVTGRKGGSGCSEVGATIHSTTGPQPLSLSNARDDGSVAERTPADSENIESEFEREGADSNMNVPAGASANSKAEPLSNPIPRPCPSASPPILPANSAPTKAEKNATRNVSDEELELSEDESETSSDS